MGQRLVLNLLLAVMVIGLGALAWLKSNETPVSDARAVSDLAPAAVERIRVTRADFPDLDFTRVGERWQLAGTRTLPADTFQVETLLALPAAVTGRYYPVTGLDLTGMGLVPPQATVVMNDRTFVLGGLEPIDQQRYVLAGDTVFLVPDSYQHLVNAGPDNFIERRPVPAGATLTGLQLPGMRLERSDDAWQLTPDNPAVASGDIEALVMRWQQLQALYVTDSATDQPAGDTVLLTLAGAADPVRLVVTARTPDLVLTRPDYGIRYHISGTPAAALLELAPPANSDP